MNKRLTNVKQMSLELFCNASKPVGHDGQCANSRFNLTFSKNIHMNVWCVFACGVGPLHRVNIQGEFLAGSSVGCSWALPIVAANSEKRIGPRHMPCVQSACNYQSL